MIPWNVGTTLLRDSSQAQELHLVSYAKPICQECRSAEGKLLFVDMGAGISINAIISSLC